MKLKRGGKGRESKQLQSFAVQGEKLIDSYLVDPASSHMLVLKIKPCMPKNKPSYGESTDGSEILENQFGDGKTMNWITLLM